MLLMAAGSQRLQVDSALHATTFTTVAKDFRWSSHNEAKGGTSGMTVPFVMWVTSLHAAT